MEINKSNVYQDYFPGGRYTIYGTSELRAYIILSELHVWTVRLFVVFVVIVIKHYKILYYFYFI